ncbi:MAG TPA: hybrid sensor histidine kinase/response regulator, partial [Desulfobacterales bacterium]|nr:hybrid sensor histidine kinase/response regulator [Desulfobacterales bacterium]
MNIEEIQGAVILIVDDNPENLGVLFDYLSELGITPLVAQSGQDAIELLEEKMPDIILLDILMPGLDGFETCKRLKANNKTEDIPIIFMTALSEITDKVRGFEAGAVDYITKPFQLEEILARIRAHLIIQRLKNDLQVKNEALQESLERERKLMEDLRLNLSISLPHELRTPLNAIIGFAGFFINPKRVLKPEKVVEYGNEIYQGGLRLNRLVENSLLYANLKLLKYASGDRKTWQRETSADSDRIIASIARQKAEELER